jgi:hypothetical protein
VLTDDSLDVTGRYGRGTTERETTEAHSRPKIRAGVLMKMKIYDAKRKKRPSVRGAYAMNMEINDS